MADVDWSAWAETSSPLVDQHDAVLLDLDGVVYVGEHAVPGAVAAIDLVRARDVAVAFVTNNASRTPADVAAHLVRLGVTAAARDVVTSAQAAAAMLRDLLDPGSAVLSIGADGLAQALQEAGLRPVQSMDDEPQAVVQGFSPHLSWPMLLEACVAVRAGLPWVATNLDSTLPTPRGTAPGNGAFVDVVRRTTGVEPQVAGKPYRPLMDASVDRLRAQRAVVVGDRLDTDLAGARRAGLPGMLVLTGVTGVRALLAADPGERPDYLAADLHGLLDAHQAPRRDAAAWMVPDGGQDGPLRAWIDDSEGLRLDGATPHPDGADQQAALAVLRLACAALWNGAGSHAAISADRVQQAFEAVRPWTSGPGWDR
ncbi:HAD-IIA family hydrolase [Angustibacter sp. McL0619]|uniref:HAD-IIA family hydrolase n=1 Tax=Angustibacter sp. McL0619 TaxID=3415676 RepID=UPI003CF45E32